MQRRNVVLSAVFALAVLMWSSAAMAQYQLTDLVSNQSGQAKHTDPLLVNAWGLVYAPGSPFWISDNGSGWSTLYSGSGVAQSLQVVIPSASGAGPGSPTGIVFNGSSEFNIQKSTAFFLFATLDGTISGWAPGVNPNLALVAVNNSGAGAVYTGLAITSNASGNHLFAADTANGKVDIYDGNFNLTGTFTDPTVPAGFTPFGIADLNGLVYVSFASSSGKAGGFIDIVSEQGTFLKRLTQGGPLNQPWGFAAAPSNFGPLSNALLISNNTNNGVINGFNAVTGKFVGTIKDTNGKAIVINQLWALDFGGGSSINGATNQLFFTAGPNNNKSGTFGMITFK